MPIKVAFIGAGSVGFTRELFKDILVVPELRDTHFAFTDINQANLDRVAKLCQKMLDTWKIPATITTTTDRRKALEGADYVINCTRIGGLEAFATDIDIPLKYGVDQCVGDTLCLGGIMYGQRNIAQILNFCKDMREVSSPDVLFLNYANPMAMNTWAALEHGKVNTVGLCHGLEWGWYQIDTVLAHKHGDQKFEWGRFDGWTERTQTICTGINHQTWFHKITYKGKPVSSAELLEAFEQHPEFSKKEKCRIDVLKRFGYYSTESNGHLSEYLPWYRKRPNEIKRYIDMSDWILGETGGYLRVCTEGQNWFKTEFPKMLQEPVKPLSPEIRGHERGSYIIESIETGRIWRGHFNVRNNGAVSNLSDDAIVEVPGYVDKLGIHIPATGPLPLGCAATCSVSIGVQRLSVAAAVSGDVSLLKQAALLDPLAGAVCNPDEIWQCIDEMLVAQAKWLPQYVANGSIDAAKKRLAKAKPLGTNKSHGAARLKTRSVDELRKSRSGETLIKADKATGAAKSGAKGKRKTVKA
jgi:alpha-galactosidase